MPVEDVFTISGRGTVVTGRIETGIVKTGDPLKLLVLRKLLKQHVLVLKCLENLLMKEELVRTAVFFLEVLKEKLLKEDKFYAKPKSITPHTEFEAEIYVLSKDEGGRHTPFL